MKRHIGLFLLAMAILILGTLPLILKILVQKIDPITLTWYRLTGAGALLAAIGGRTLLSDLKANATARGTKLVVTTGAGLIGNYVLFVTGLLYLSPSTAHIVLQITPFLILAGGVLLYREPFNIRLVLGVLLLETGSALFFNQRYAEIRWGTDFVVGVGILIICAVSWAVFFLTQKALHPTMRSSTIIFCCCAIGSVTLLPFASHSSIACLDGRLLIFLTCSTIATAVSYTSLSTAMRTISATTTGLAIATVPLVTVFAMMLLASHIDGLFEENLNTLAVVGAVLVVIGLMVGTMKPRPFESI